MIHAIEYVASHILSGTAYHKYTILLQFTYVLTPESLVRG